MLSKILKQKRTEFGLTQQEVAEELNVTRQTVSNWEVGKNIPDILTLIEISNLYKISLDSMFKGDDKVTNKLKQDTYELQFLRHFSLTTLIILGLLLILVFPPSIFIVIGFFLFFTIFKKKKLKILVKEKVEENNMDNNPMYILRKLANDALSILGIVFLFYTILELFTKNNFLEINGNDYRLIFPVIFFFVYIIGRYFSFWIREKRK